MFRIDDMEVVDATMKGSAARFINHSCDVSSRIPLSKQQYTLGMIEHCAYHMYDYSGALEIYSSVE